VTTFRRVIQTAVGEPADVMTLEELPIPTPGPGQVLIRMQAAALHIADTYYSRGRYGFVPAVPCTPGFEGIGVVEETGAGAESWLGQRVFPPIGSGTLSEYVVAEAAAVVPAPEGDAQQLALTLVNGSTALTLIEDFRPLAAGDWLIQNAANSNCGRYVMKLAKQRGINTVNVVRRPELIEELHNFGAEIVLLDGEDLPDQVEAATGDAAITIGLDAVAGEATARLADCLSDGGLVVNYGAVTRENCQMSFFTMVRRDISLCGMSMGRQMAQRDAGEKHAAYEFLAQAISRGELATPIAASYPLSDYVEALDHAGRVGESRPGKIIVTF
jgi:trans-2-enoyl-CoA reductase